MISSDSGLTETEIERLVTKDQIKASEAISLVANSKPGEHLNIDTDCWTLREEIPAFGRYATAKELQIILEHKEELEIRFPISPLAFYRWTYIPGNPIRLHQDVIDAFAEKSEHCMYELSRADIYKITKARSGWRLDLTEVIIDLLDEQVIPTRELIIERLAIRSSDYITRVDPDTPSLKWRTDKNKMKILAGRGFTDPIDTVIRNLKDTAAAIQCGSYVVELRTK